MAGQQARFGTPFCRERREEQGESLMVAAGEEVDNGKNGDSGEDGEGTNMNMGAQGTKGASSDGDDEADEDI